MASRLLPPILFGPWFLWIMTLLYEHDHFLSPQLAKREENSNPLRPPDNCTKSKTFNSYYSLELEYYSLFNHTIILLCIELVFQYTHKDHRIVMDFSRFPIKMDFWYFTATPINVTIKCGMAFFTMPTCRLQTYITWVTSFLCPLSEIWYL